MNMAAVWGWKKEVVPFTAMAIVEFTTVGVNTVFKAATFKGLTYFVFIGYSYVLGTLLLLPLPFISPRREQLPSLEPSLFYRIALLALIGLCADMCAYKGIEYSSPTLASAISNLTPAFTFLLALIFRMEKLDLRSSSTHAKIIGTIFSISGALIAVLYKGPTILSSSPSSQANWALGGLLLVSQFVLSSIWYILQTKVIRTYPDAKTVVLLYLLCTSVMALPICFVVEPNLSAWAVPLRTKIASISVVASGLFGSSFCPLVHTWGLLLKGPLYVVIFRPFSIAIAAAVGYVFLGDCLSLGSVIGATILLIGFYAVLWGKAQEEEANTNHGESGDNNLRASLVEKLQS